ncbi:uncharacterized protein LOC8082033 [Sorghum bicolor]|uniref:Cystatin domain-containing protein n=1 Tax=Sorghum bicolor TaxID=4558 RepID=C5WVW7_SORBI|nr:uncharacterized protein LOC8082033 [Sorghum bicolor]EER92771.1 hypothetical protein SORBI_3001G487400 [Sorghum bicolor]|eukprot:XP_021307523.1 uncharacterized protein LOC8082033 [Sorghum bicolor]
MRSLLALLVTALVAVVVAFPDGADAVSWTPIANPGTTLVKQVGNFCVIVYSNSDRRRHLPLQLVIVVRGETQPAAVGNGISDYRLVLNVKNTDTGSTALYQCVVRGKPGSRSTTWVLLSFVPYTQAP